MAGRSEGQRPKIIVVCGPTASGKSELALHVARQCNGELVGADSMQIYKGLAVGTAALAAQDTGGIAQHLVGFLPPSRAFSVAEYVEAADEVIGQITRRGKVPVLCGGTGLYISSVVQGINFTEESPSDSLQEQLWQQWEQQGGEAMLAKLGKADPAHAEKLHAADQKRILRSLALYQTTGLSYEERKRRSRPAQPPYRALCLGLRFENRADLYSRINRRVDRMLEQGLLEEAGWVHQNRRRFATAAQAIGYKEFFPYFEGAATLEMCTEALKQATRQYAKRQLTWFGRMDGIHWLYADAPNCSQQAEQLANHFLQADT